MSKKKKYKDKSRAAAKRREQAKEYHYLHAPRTERVMQMSSNTIQVAKPINPYAQAMRNMGLGFFERDPVFSLKEETINNFTDKMSEEAEKKGF